MSVDVPRMQIQELMTIKDGPCKRKREVEAWTPYMRQRADMTTETSEFLARTTALFRELQRDMAAKVLEARKQEAANRAESLRVAQMFPLVPIEVASEHVAKSEDVAAEVTPCMHPTSPDSIPEPMPKADRKKTSQARETPAMGPVKAGSISDDVPAQSAFSRSLNFVVGHESETSDGARKRPEFLSLTPAALV